MRKKSVLWLGFALLLWIVPAWGAQASNVMTVSAGDGKVTTADPDCDSVGAWCGWINVILPPGSQYDSATVYASTDGQNFVECPRVLNGAKYQYMDCTSLHIRYLKIKPVIATTSAGVQVNWNMVNWNNHKVWGKLVVDYH